MKRNMMFAALFAPIAAVGAQTPAADVAGSALVQKNCSSCHALSQVTTAHKSKDDWSATVDKMIGFGAQVSDKDYEVIVDYLARVQGPQK